MNVYKMKNNHKVFAIIGLVGLLYFSWILKLQMLMVFLQYNHFTLILLLKILFG